MLRSLGSFLIAPVPVALFQAFVVGLWPKPGTGVFENPPSVFVAICLYFYLFGLIVGLPIWFILRKRLAMTMREYALLGAIVGLAPAGAALLYLGSQGQASAYVVAYNVLLFGLGGVLVGTTYWYIAVRQRRVEILKRTFS